MLLDIGHITVDPDIQPRSRLIPNVVIHFREILNLGAVLDPVSVFNDGSTLWLSDGYHRLGATRKAGFRTTNAEIFEGTKRDAILFAIEQNANHGFRLTLAERKTAATMPILDHEWQTWSSCKIGQWCGLDHKTVEKIKPSQILQTVSGDFPRYKILQNQHRIYLKSAKQYGKVKFTKFEAYQILQTVSGDFPRYKILQNQHRIYLKSAKQYGKVKFTKLTRATLVVVLSIAKTPIR